MSSALTAAPICPRHSFVPLPKWWVPKRCMAPKRHGSPPEISQRLKLFRCEQSLRSPEQFITLGSSLWLWSAEKWASSCSRSLPWKRSHENWETLELSSLGSQCSSSKLVSKAWCLASVKYFPNTEDLLEIPWTSLKCGAISSLKLHTTSGDMCGEHDSPCISVYLVTEFFSQHYYTTLTQPMCQCFDRQKQNKWRLELGCRSRTVWNFSPGAQAKIFTSPENPW